MVAKAYLSLYYPREAISIGPRDQAWDTDMNAQRDHLPISHLSLPFAHP